MRQVHRHKGISIYRFSECLHTEFNSLTFPVFLKLCKILAAFLRHPVLANLISVVSNSSPHLEWVQMLEGLYGCNKVGELVDRGKMLEISFRICS
jgi:hypothetical protein